MKKIYLFDFDDTIYRGDSFVHFTFYSQTFINFLFFWISVVVQLSVGKSKSQIKESFFFRFKDMRQKDFKILCKNFYKKKIKKNIKKSFIRYLKEIEKDAQIVIVSASIGDYIEPFCKEKDIHLISTELEINNDKLTGIFKTPNCKGKEKVDRIRRIFNLSNYNEIIAFGNSDGDKQMLELATKKYFKYFS